MGLLRVYLALCVVATHSNSVLPWTTHNGSMAVEIFFVVSGFYMEMVLSQRYQSVKEFYTSRWLRIFVPYYLVLLLVVSWSAVMGAWSGDWLALAPYVSNPLSVNGLTGVIVASVSNIMVLFQDWVLFLEQDRGKSLAFTANFLANENPLAEYLLIPQAWSIGIELTFYLLVPFIHKLRTRTLFMLLISSLAARVAVYQLGFRFDPWTYRFFPFELALFLLGMIGWRIYAKFDFGSRLPSCTRYSSYFIASGLLLFALYLHAMTVQRFSAAFGNERTVLLSYFLWPVVIAGLFACFRRNSLDRFIGELSYPIYLIHLIVIQTMQLVLIQLKIPELYLGELSALVTVGLTLVISMYVLQPFERWRHAFVRRKTEQDRASSTLLIGEHSHTQGSPSASVTSG